MEKVAIEISKDVYERLKSELTEEQIVEINSYKDFIGKKVFLRTVTYHLVGEVTKQVGQFLFLKNTSWVADSGRFMQSIADGKLDEVEPIGDWFVNINAIVDGGIWKHTLALKQS